MSPTLTFIMPAYNEEGAIADAIDDVRKAAFDVVPDCTLIVVNDGSRDRTGAIVDAICASDKRVQVIHKPNGGHGSSLIAGVRAAKSDYVFLLDSDRQIPLDNFAEFWSAGVGRDAVFGVRAVRHDPLSRLILTRIIRMVVFFMFSTWIRDGNVPCKLLKRSIWKQAEDLIPDGTLAPSFFLAIFARYSHMDVIDKVVTHRERNTGVVSIRYFKLAKFCFKAFAQLIEFRLKLLKQLKLQPSWRNHTVQWKR
jgi:dolichol-phosphate mannosyltransferase